MGMIKNKYGILNLPVYAKKEGGKELGFTFLFFFFLCNLEPDL